MIIKHSFEQVSFSNALTLIEVIETSTLRTLTEIKRRYLERAEYFLSNVEFLSLINVVEYNSGRLSLSANFEIEDLNSSKRTILEFVTRTNNRYRNEIYWYLSKYHVKDDLVLYQPQTKDLSKESAVRNFLIEIGVVAVIPETGEYEVNENFRFLYSNARNSRNLLPPHTLEKNLEDSASIGESAERSILNFERIRLGPRFHDRIKHVSSFNQAAGYDIESLTVTENELVIPRFIEVKAVPFPTYTFFWSTAEARAAQDLSVWYWLYLLPVGLSGRFEQSKLRAINNPFKEVLSVTSEWKVEADGFKCHLLYDRLT